MSLVEVAERKEALPPESAMGGDETARISNDLSEGIFTCPMHLSVRKKGPGACPVCGMALVERVATTDVEPSLSGSLTSVTLSPSEQVLANVRTVRSEVMTLRKEIRAVGRIAAAESRSVQLTAKFPGRIENLHLNFTGQAVRVGDPVAEMYSPEAISAQNEFLLAKSMRGKAPGERGAIGSNAESLYVRSREKLALWGFTESQIETLSVSGVVRRHVTIVAPISGTVTGRFVDPQQYVQQGEKLFDLTDLSHVWMIIDVYEEDVHLVRTGQEILAHQGVAGGDDVRGVVAFVSPSVNPGSRTVTVRADLDNGTNRLRPGMFLDATIVVQLDRALCLPSSAVVLTGDRAVVFVQTGTNVFTPRIVITGYSAEGYTQVLRGVKAGETIAVSGGYLLDSESRLQGGS
jgi:Cu(I)/Ag(I) efflux system membrane fusion protein